MRGMIKKRTGKRGVSYQVIVDLPRDPETGKRRQKWITVKTKQEADALVAKMVTSVNNGDFAEADAKKITVSEYLTRWLSSIEQSVKPSTQRRYADVVRSHIVPKIGRVQLAKLTPLQVQNLYTDRLTEGKLSPTTVAMLHNILHRALKQAVRWNLLTRNVTEAVEPPRETTPEYVTWNERQVSQFLAVADKDEFAALWRLALLTGMRRGEIMGLKWEDVDLQRSVLHVQRTLSRDSAGSYTLGTPKTAHGRRSIALPRSAVESLRKHRVRQAEHKLLVGEAYKDDDFVFVDPFGEPLHPNTLTYRFKRLTKQAKLPVIRFHDLRHTSATLMLANNTNAKIVQERLGHANISITLDRYSHVTMDMQRQAADGLDELIGGV